MRTLNVSEDGFIKLMRIKSDRLQDTSRADTFDYILRVYEESYGTDPIPAKHAPGSVTQPAIINADELQNKAYMDSKRSIAQTIRNLKTTYPPEENKE